MTRLTLATLVGLALASAVAWRLGGALGKGVMAGYLLGASLAVLGALAQRWVFMRRPDQSLAAFALGFLTKLTALFVFVLVFRFFEPLGGSVDWRSFAVSFAAAVALVVPFGAFDAVRILRASRAA